MISTIEPEITSDNVKIIDFNNESIFKESNNLFLSKSWFNVLIKEYGFKFKIVVDPKTNDNLTFALVEHLGGKKIVSIPFADYTVPNTVDEKSLLKLIEPLKENYPEHAIILKLPFDATPKNIMYFGKPVRLAYFHRVLTSSRDEILNNYSSSFKRGIKKALKNNITTRINQGENALKTFYRLYYGLRINKFESIPQPYSFFKNICEEFMKSGKGFFFEALKDDIVIASVIILEHQQVWYYKFGCSNPDYLDLRPNNIIFNDLFMLASDQQIMEVDLGLSGASESYAGLVRFKEGMGGQRNFITNFRYNPDNYDTDREAELNKMLKEITAKMVDHKLDLKTTDNISKSIYKYFA